MSTHAAANARFNPVFWLMWLLPASAVLAGFTTLAIALKNADRPLPADYHWEGNGLDEDFARAEAAAALGLDVTLDFHGGQCRAVMRNLPTDPAALNLLLTHGSYAALDRRIRLSRVAAGEYHVACAPLESGRWRVGLDDDTRKWSIRGSLDDRVTTLQIRADGPDGDEP